MFKCLKTQKKGVYFDLLYMYVYVYMRTRILDMGFVYMCGYYISVKYTFIWNMQII